jgi:glutaminyl-tRNA synthetase
VAFSTVLISDYSAFVLKKNWSLDTGRGKKAGSRGGNAPGGRRVRGTSHWVSAEHAIPAEVRLYDRLFNKPHPMNVKDGSKFTDHINPDSLKTTTQCKLESSLKSAQKGSQYQFERLGYFCVDSDDSTEQHLVFNRTISLRDSWKKIEKSSKG